MKHKKTNPPDEAQPLTEVEWNFDPVPQAQLEVCCLWEYARESALLRSIRGRSAEACRMGLERKDLSAVVRHDFCIVFNKLGRKAILFQEGIYGFGGGKCYPDFVSPFPAPWQSLSEYQKQVLMETASWSVKEVAPMPGFRRAGHPYLLALTKLFHPKRMDEVFNRKTDPSVQDFFHSGHKLREICPNLLNLGGQEILLVEIDWGGFTDAQLLKDFAQWLKENEPPGIGRPDGRGRHKEGDWRANLTRLAVMRLLARFTAHELVAADRYPAIWKTQQFSARKWGDVTKWYDARRESGKLFHSLLQSAPNEEHPLSWTRQTRSKLRGSCQQPDK